ncbi:MAG: RidA family protein [Phycisphaerales bacterium]|nr:RidA family protein [Phycisphaerales bacterium]
MHDLENRLSQLGIELPEPPAPVAAYVPWVRTGNLVLVSGQVPFVNGELIAKGPVPSAVSLEEAGHAARMCAVNGLAVLRAALNGDLQRLRRVVRLGAFVQCDDRFEGQPGVANGASELMVELLGDAGRHARAAVGVNALPLDASVEVEFTFEVE